MRWMVRTVLTSAVMVLAAAPRPAHAEGFVVPWIGAAFSQTDLQTTSDRKPSFGAALGTMGSGGIFGFDVDFGFTPSFFGSEATAGTNKLITVTANLLVGPSIESSGGRGVRPYANVGIGLIHTSIASASDNKFGWDLGGGVMGFFSSNLGIRGDLKYFHSVNNNTVEDTVLLNPGDFHYWRAYAGLIIR